MKQQINTPVLNIWGQFMNKLRTAKYKQSLRVSMRRVHEVGERRRPARAAMPCCFQETMRAQDTGASGVKNRLSQDQHIIFCDKFYALIG